MNSLIRPLAVIWTLTIGFVGFISLQTLAESETPAMLQRGSVISSKLVYTWPTDRIERILRENKHQNLLPASHRIIGVKVEYRTIGVNGEPATASGLLVFPNNTTGPLHPALYMHGTEAHRQQVPSTPDDRHGRRYAAVFSGVGGYALAMPDYLGLGSSDYSYHPYMHGPSMASAAVDLLRAQQQIAVEYGYQLSNELMIGGYSQGGWGAIYAQKVIEEQHGDIFQVKASAPGAGPHDMLFQSHITFTEPSPSSSAYLAYYVFAYNRIYGVLDPLDSVLQQGYDEALKQLFDGTKDMPAIAGSLPPLPSGLIKASAAARLEAGLGSWNSDFGADLGDWIPKAPVLLLGASGDRTVPYQQVEITAHHLKARGATVKVFDAGDSLDHRTSRPKILTEQLFFFNNSARAAQQISH